MALHLTKCVAIRNKFVNCGMRFKYSNMHRRGIFLSSKLRTIPSIHAHAHIIDTRMRASSVVQVYDWFVARLTSTSLCFLHLLSEVRFCLFVCKSLRSCTTESRNSNTLQRFEAASEDAAVDGWCSSSCNCLEFIEKHI